VRPSPERLQRDFNREPGPPAESNTSAARNPCVWPADDPAECRHCLHDLLRDGACSNAASQMSKCCRSNCARPATVQRRRGDADRRGAGGIRLARTRHGAVGRIAICQIACDLPAIFGVEAGTLTARPVDRLTPAAAGGGDRDCTRASPSVGSPCSASCRVLQVKITEGSSLIPRRASRHRLAKLGNQRDHPAAGVQRLCAGAGHIPIYNAGLRVHRTPFHRSARPKRLVGRSALTSTPLAIRSRLPW